MSDETTGEKPKENDTNKDANIIVGNIHFINLIEYSIYR